MAQMIINFPDNQQTRIIDALAALFVYRPTIGGAPNPETKAQFVRRMVILNFKNLVAQGEGKLAIDLANNEIAPS